MSKCVFFLKFQNLSIIFPNFQMPLLCTVQTFELFSLLFLVWCSYGQCLTCYIQPFFMFLSTFPYKLSKHSFCKCTKINSIQPDIYFKYFKKSWLILEGTLTPPGLILGSVDAKHACPSWVCNGLVWEHWVAPVVHKHTLKWTCSSTSTWLSTWASSCPVLMTRWTSRSSGTVGPWSSS